MNRFSSRLRPATRFPLIASTTPLTGAVFATISPTELMTLARPLLIFTSSPIVAMRYTANAAMISAISRIMTASASDISVRLVREGDVERAPVVGNRADDLADVVLRRQQQHHRVQVLRSGLGDAIDRVDPRHDALRRPEDALEQASEQEERAHEDEVHDPQIDHDQPPVALRTTSAAFAAIPGRTPAMTCSGPLMASTQPFRPRRCCASTVASAPPRSPSPFEMMIRRLRTWFSPMAKITTSNAAST